MHYRPRQVLMPARWSHWLATYPSTAPSNCTFLDRYEMDRRAQAMANPKFVNSICGKGRNAGWSTSMFITTLPWASLPRSSTRLNALAFQIIWVPEICVSSSLVIFLSRNLLCRRWTTWPRSLTPSWRTWMNCLTTSPTITKSKVMPIDRMKMR